MKSWFSEAGTVNSNALVSPAVTPSDAPAACSDELATNSDAPACLMPCVVFPSALSTNPDAPAYLTISPCVVLPSAPSTNPDVPACVDEVTSKQYVIVQEWNLGDYQP
ncbi:hypothetical protein JTE90_026441 [Oedothorax gibbosus]|uniref:Uncharacterized protein n=1 Tax=Oedothorax gibbosus TaxID=931172 RepID=A0AAV6VPH9_9ARAC|nr:hypothetical protein JTE90_026441 [Oedothorax gibbosus]